MCLPRWLIQGWLTACTGSTAQCKQTCGLTNLITCMQGAVHTLDAEVRVSEAVTAPPYSPDTRMHAVVLTTAVYEAVTIHLTQGCMRLISPLQYLTAQLQSLSSGTCLPVTSHSALGTVGSCWEVKRSHQDHCYSWEQTQSLLTLAASAAAAAVAAAVVAAAALKATVLIGCFAQTGLEQLAIERHQWGCQCCGC